jgi:serine/threonine protein kinase
MMPWDLHKQYLANEVQTLLRLSGCPNVVQLYDIYEDAGNIFMVFELIDGEELFDMICANGFYSEHEAVEILRAVCRGLKACHDRNVMHRDIKPENIMCPITDNNTHDLSKATIIDFGLAAILEPGTYATEASGSPGYVAPEILVGCPYDRAVDMWSLGVTAYILLAGYPPWVEDIEVPVEDQIIAGDYEFHSPEWDDVSATAKDWIRRLLVLDPTKRMTVSEALQHPFLKLSVAPAQIKVEYADSNKPVKKSDVPPPIVKPANTKPKSESTPNVKPASKPDKPPVEVVKPEPASTRPDQIKPLDIPIEVIGKTESTGSARTVKPSPRVTSPRLQIQTVLPPQRKSTLVSVTEENDHKAAQQPAKEPAATQKPFTPVKETPKDTHKEPAPVQKPATEKPAHVTEKPPAQQPATPVRQVVTEKPAPTQTPVTAHQEPKNAGTSTPTDQTKTKKCPKCNATISQGAKICGNCTKVEPAAPTPKQGATTYAITTSNTPSPLPVKTIGNQQAGPGPSPVIKRFGYKAPDHVSNIPVIREQASQTTQLGGYKAPDHISNIPVIREQITQKTGQGYRPPDHITNIPVIREQALKGSVLHKYIPPDHTTNIPVVREKWDPQTNEFKTVKELVQASPSLSQKPKFPKKGQGRPLRGKRADTSANDKENKI